MKRILAATILAILVPAYSVLAQCSMCAATVEANGKEGGQKAAAGLNTGILYLMVFPYVLFAIVGFVWYRNVQKKKALHAR